MSSGGTERMYPRAFLRCEARWHVRALAFLFGVLAAAAWCNAQIIDVAPGDETVFRFFGYEGGPFAAQSATSWTIRNVDVPGLDFLVSSNQLWLKVAPTSGTLDAVIREPRETITAALASTEAARLAPGTYSATITFSNTTNGQGTTTRALQLEVAPANFSVAPTVVQAEMFANGEVPTPITITLTSQGQTDLNYRLSWVSRSWFNVDKTSGTVPGGGSGSFDIHFAGFSLDGGATSAEQSAQLTITNTTNGQGTITIPITLTVVSAGAGAVTLTPDEDLSIHGAERRLATAIQASKLFNQSTQIVLWGAEVDADWITVTPAGGWLDETDYVNGGPDTQDITFRINTAVNDLPAGSHTATATLQNETTGVGIGSRTFRVDVDPVLSLTSNAIAGTVEVAPRGGVLADAFADSRRYPFGQVVTLTAYVADGFAFAGWAGDLVDQVVNSDPGSNIDIVQVGGDAPTTPVDTGPVLDNPIVVTMSRSRSITALMVPLHRELVLSFTGSGTGTVQQSPSGDQVDNALVSRYVTGANVQLLAEADAGSAFVRWAGNIPPDSGITNPLTIQMDRDRTIAAVFEPRVAFGVEVGGEGTVTVEPDWPAYGAGTELTLTATPDGGFVFDGWSGGVTGVDATLTIVLNQDTFLTARFVPEGEEGTGGGDGETGAKLFVDIVGDGTVSPSGGSFDEGAEVMLVATPGVGSMFVRWEGAASGADLTTLVTVSGNTAVRAVFETDPEAGRDVPDGSSSLPMCGSFGLATLPMVLLGWLTSTWARRRRRVV